MTFTSEAQNELIKEQTRQRLAFDKPEDPTAKDCSKQYSTETIGVDWPERGYAQPAEPRSSLVSDLRRRRENLQFRIQTLQSKVGEINRLIFILEDND